LNLSGFLNLYDCYKFLCFIDLAYVKELDLSYSNVSCLELKFLVNLNDMKKLRALSLCSTTNVKNLSCLLNLENLLFLDLNSTCVINLECLKYLKNLKFLNLNYCFNVFHLKWLMELVNLMVLKLSYCYNICDFSFLNKLHKLEDLDLSYTRFDDDDLKWLEGLDVLKILNLSGTRNSCEALENIKNKYSNILF
jgi:hypothetical protein